MFYRLYANSVCDMNSVTAAAVCGTMQVLYAFAFDLCNVAEHTTDIV